VTISGADPQHMEEVVKTSAYRQDPNFLLLRQQQKKTQGVLQGLELSQNSGGLYHFKATYITDKPERLTTAVLYHIVKPTCIKTPMKPGFL